MSNKEIKICYIKEIRIDMLCTTSPSVHLAKGRSKGSMPAGATPYSSIDSPAKLTLGSQSMPGGSTGNLPQPPKIRRNESNMSFPSGSVSMSSVEVGAVSVPGTPLKTSLTRQLSELEKREDEDLYRYSLSTAASRIKLIPYPFFSLQLITQQ